MPTDVTTSGSAAENYDASCNAPAGGDPRTSASVRNPLQNLNNRIRFAWARLQEIVGSFLPLGGLIPTPLSVSSSTFTLAGHGLSNGYQLYFWAVGAAASLPAPLDGYVSGTQANLTTYYAVNVTSNTFQVSGTSGGGAIALTTIGVGSIYAAWQNPGSAISVLLQSVYTTIASSVAAVNPVATYSRFSLLAVWSSGGWQWADNGYAAVSASAPELAYPIVVPQGATLNSVTVDVAGSPSDTTLVALNLPSLSVYKVSANGTRTQIGTTTTDAPISIAAYKIAHAISVTGLATQVDNSAFSYFAELIGEGGGGANAGMLAYSLVKNWTGPAMG